ncbi:MAG TPA: TIGR00730 family Rossman fold protein [Spirochaetia bacterium]|nr:MAG: Rossman fold protein, TIGR00730 family [Spirochaetes bacterium GWB1_36_13]HCL57890.1 TIGR00730 family Rossman fold protein [Spirochaetia bacterium]
MDILGKYYELKEEPWRIFRIMSEFVEGFEEMSLVSPAVSIFGSARTLPDNRYYRQAEEVAYLLGKEKFNIITGGGPGIMEAANKGAKRAGVQSIGLNIELPMEVRVNEFVNRPLSFRYFFIRKVMFAKYASAFIAMPGGFGTLDELCEILTLIQTEKMISVPFILIGKDYWQGLVEWLQNKVLEEKNISSEDLNLFTVTDDLNEAVKIIKTNYQKLKNGQSNGI